ncbi:MAG: SIMPL domain-containing protein [Sulfuricaulis sp.]|uniref:SIMPL domain-containing protein n=1 Tax=Sulfuricaulis sp. TaxID=2003553 RepID=UPI003C41AE27
MPLFARLLIISLILGLAAANQATAADGATRYNQIHFQVERSRPVENDRMQAVLSLTAEDDNAARLADHINRSMGAALKTAKARAKVEARSGSYRTYPVYNKEKIQRWRATQELLLEGSDFAELGSLIGQLQERLQVTSLNFSVSPARRAAVEDELIAQTLDTFKQRAELVRKQLTSKGYRIVDVSINTGGGQPVPIMMRTTAMEAASVAPPALEAGTSTVTVSVGGVIELQ